MHKDTTAPNCIGTSSCSWVSKTSYRDCTESILAGTNGAIDSSGTACLVCELTLLWIIFLVVRLPLPWWVTINSAQVKVINMNGSLVFYRGATNYCTGTWDCDGLSETTSESSFWEQCCTTEMCNNVSIPADVSSLAELEQCYLGQTPAECYGEPVLLSRLRNHWNNDTHSLSVESH